MNNKGFTLIELITVIALLSIIGVILMPKISNAFKITRADQLEEVRQNVKNATEIYLSDDCGKSTYEKLISDDNVRIYLNSINECGLIDKKIYNPVSGKYFNIDNEYIDVTIDEVGMMDYSLSF